ncbi:hypothetical protein YPPY101_2462 [Yersinia pestis PY-101]|uniref:Uncharacterized protein n=2 Tax=Yersinia pseudotuberculosis complex TaxID=1649845 RepID=A0A0H3B3A6_YERPY|nr:hypothetical protein YPIP275_1469 [Yersinia pestis biovar Orientalis str. IP275]EIR90721.1 hypothetical protein YPPY42_2570 [Yersinia pestis PY-42]EIT46066.1 hypothetical protein YPPY101_2462 [Yersinia pestis PY-101]
MLILCVDYKTLVKFSHLIFMCMTENQSLTEQAPNSVKRYPCFELGSYIDYYIAIG